MLSLDSSKMLWHGRMCPACFMQQVLKFNSINATYKEALLEIVVWATLHVASAERPIAGREPSSILGC